MIKRIISGFLILPLFFSSIPVHAKQQETNLRAQIEQEDVFAASGAAVSSVSGAAFSMGANKSFDFEDELAVNIGSSSDIEPVGAHHITPWRVRGTLRGASSKDWAYALFHALESNLLKKGEYELSSEIELDVDYFNSYLYAEDRSEYLDLEKYGNMVGDKIIHKDESKKKRGNSISSIWGLAAGGGLRNKKNTEDTYRLLDTDIIYGGDVNRIKNAIKTRGAVVAAIIWDDKFLKEIPDPGGEPNDGGEAFHPYTYYVPSGGTESTFLNHAVTIIGWDDSYDKTNFVVQPKNNGAWLVEDSYGNPGHYWVSYEDFALSEKSKFYSFDIEKNVTNKNIYQYDGGSSHNRSPQGNKNKAVNIFLKNGVKEKLTDVSFGTMTYNAQYKIQIYKNARPAANDQGQPVLSEPVFKEPVLTPEISNWGYHTVSLEKYLREQNLEDIILEKTEEASYFAVEIEIVGTEEPYFWVDTYNHIETSGIEYDVNPNSKGESYAYENGKWIDLGTATPGNTGTNVRIKAITEDQIHLRPQNGNEMWQTENSLNPAKKQIDVYRENRKYNTGITWSSSNTNVAAVDANGVVTAAAAGKAEITAQSDKYGSYSTEITVKDFTVDVKPSGELYANSKKLEKRTGQIEYKIYPENSDSPVTAVYELANPADAVYLTVTSDGKLHAVKPKENIPVNVTLKLKGSNLTSVKQTNVSVYNVPETITIADEAGLPIKDLSIKTDEKKKLTLKFTPDSAKGKIIWKSSNPEVVYIKSDGTAVGLKKGTAVISAVSEDSEAVRADVQITVSDSAASLFLSENYILLKDGNDQKKIYANILPESYTDAKIKWTILDLQGNQLPLDNEVISFEESTGIIKAKKDSTAAENKVVLWAECDGQKDSCYIEVLREAADLELSFAEITGTEVITEKTVKLPEDSKPLPLYVKLYPEALNGSNEKIIFSSDRPEVARVSQSGTVTPLSFGKATITAKTSNGHAKSVTLHVENSYPDSKIQLIPKETNLYANAKPETNRNKTTLKILVGEKEVSPEMFDFISVNPDILKVEPNGVVTALKRGNGTIRAVDKTQKDYKAEISISSKIMVEEIVLDRKKIELAVGGETTVGYTLLPEDADKEEIMVNCGDSAIVGCTGIILIGKKVGTTYFRIRTTNGAETIIPLEVVEKCASSLKAEIDRTILYTSGLNSTARITGSALNESNTTDGISQTFAYLSTDRKIADVSADGVVTARSPGKTKIRVWTPDGSNLVKDFNIEVRQQVESIETEKRWWYVKENSALQLNRKVLPEDAFYYEDAEWKISSYKDCFGRNVEEAKRTVQVTPDGKVTVGNADLGTVVEFTCSVPDSENVAKSSIRIVDNDVKSMMLNYKKLDLNKGASRHLIASAKPEDIVWQEDVRWYSDNEEIAVVDADGIVTGIGAGTAVITAETFDGKMKASCKVAVYPIDKTIKLEKIPNQVIESYGVNPDSSYQIKVYTAARDADYSTLCNFKSSKESICTVDENGLVRPVYGAVSGSSTITAELAGDPLKRKLSFKVSLVNEKQIHTIRTYYESNSGKKEASLSNPIYLRSIKGKNVTLSAAAYDQNDEYRQETRLKWTVSDKSILSIKDEKDGTAVITIKKPGVCTVICSASDKKKTAKEIKVVVYDAAPSFEAEPLLINLAKKEQILLPVYGVEGTKLQEMDLQVVKMGKKYTDSSSFSIFKDDSGQFYLSYDAESLKTGSYSITTEVSMNVFNEGLKAAYGGKENLSEKLEIPIKVINKKPSIKAKFPVINVFSKNSTGDLSITSNEKIESIQLADSAGNGIQDKFKITDNGRKILALTDTEGSYRGTLHVKLAGYPEPFQIGAVIKTVKKAPKLSVLTSKLYTCKDEGKTAKISFQIKNMDNEEIISAAKNYKVSDSQYGAALNGDLITAEFDGYGKKSIELVVENPNLWNGSVRLKVSVTVEDAKKIALTVDKNKLVLNKGAVSDTCELGVRMRQTNVGIEKMVAVYISDSKGELLNKEDFEIAYSNNKLRIGLKQGVSYLKGKYKVKVEFLASNAGSYLKEIPLVIEDVKPSAKVKLKGSVNLFDRLNSEVEGDITVLHTQNKISEVTCSRSDFNVQFDAAKNKIKIKADPNKLFSNKKQKLVLRIKLSTGYVINKEIVVNMKEQKLVFGAIGGAILHKTSNKKSAEVCIPVKSPENIEIKNARITILSVPKGLKAVKSTNGITVTLADGKMKAGSYNVKISIKAKECADDSKAVVKTIKVYVRE